MSMFHELMMRKKEEIMYATIKGSLTENDGVFSGFSASDYLQLQQTIKPTSAFEIKLKFKVSDRSITNGLFHSSQTLVTGSGRFGFALVTASNGKLNFFASANGTSWLFDEKSANWLIQNNVDYYVKFGWTGTEYYVDLSSDDTTYNRVISYNSTTPVTQLINYSSIGIYRAVDNIYPLTGSIDLNKSYIKLGSTKYNLQAVVGYTIVGSPTVTDGVVSGFSSANYLQTSSSYTTNNMNNDNYEFCVKLTPASSMGSECYAIKYYNGSTVKGLGISNNKLAWSVGYPTTSGHKGTILSSFTVTTNTTYWLKGIYKNKIASLYYSLDGTNYTLIESIDETDQTFKITSAFNFGATAGSSYGLFLGSIDMKETYIKINNKLWFNGQQA